MSKHKIKCPFCHEPIPKIYEVRTTTKHKRHKTRIKIIKEVIGEDWAEHGRQCKKLNDFLSSTKNEEIHER